MMKTGQIVKITDMGCGHLQNSIAMLERAKQEYTKAYDGLMAEWIRRQNSGNPCPENPKLVHLKTKTTPQKLILKTRR